MADNGINERPKVRHINKQLAYGGHSFANYPWQFSKIPPRHSAMLPFNNTARRWKILGLIKDMK